MGIVKLQQQKILYIAPEELGGKFQNKNLGLPVREVTKEEFLDRLFGKFSGYLCVFMKDSDGRPRNEFFKHKHREKLLYFLEMSYGNDTYLSYSTFFSIFKKDKETKLRVQKNIVNTHMLVQDLDYYKFGISDAECLKRIGKMIRDGVILCPTFIVATGRGYQLIWMVEPFKNIEGYAADRDWRAIQEHLFQTLKELNSDSVVKNPSAVTRMPGSKHSTSKKVVNAYLSNEVVFNLNDFLMFHDLVPMADRKVKPKKVNPNRPVTRLVGNWNDFTLNRQREEDIFTYVEVMNERGGLPKDTKRNWLALVLRFHALVSTNGDTKYAEERVESLCKIIDLTETSQDEILRRSKSADKYYDEWINDTWNREKYLRGGLFYTNARMLEIMDIKEDYYVQWRMKTIKILNKKYDAARKRFEKYQDEEEANKHTWEGYQNRRNEKIAVEKEDKLWQLKKTLENHPDWTNAQIMDHLKWSESTVKRYKRLLK